jgi:hypothetical protein
MAGYDVDGSTSTVFRLAGKTYVCMLITASSSPSPRRERRGWRRVGLGRGESSADERGESGEGEQGEWLRWWGECGDVDLSSEEPNVISMRNCV